MRVRAIVLRIFRQFRRDKRSLALMFIAPLFVLTLMWLVFNGDQYEPKIAVVDAPDQLVSVLKQQDAEILTLDKKDAWGRLDEGSIDALINMEDHQPSIVIEGSDSTANRAVQMTLQNALKSMVPQQIHPEFTYLHGGLDLGMFDYTGPVLIGFFVFFFVFILGGVSFLRERTQGTLERLLSTPLKRWEIVTGYLIGFGLFTIIQSLLIAWYSIEVLGMWMEGSFGYVMLITFLLAITALTLATLLSAFANNEFQMVQFIPIVIVPQVFFSGMFNLDTMAPWLRAIGKVMPLTYGADALQDIMIRGKGIEAFWGDILILVGFALVFFILNILALKKHRKL